MHTLSLISVIVVSILHYAFMIIEIFLWQKPAGKKIFGLGSEFAAQSASLAGNQGLYNGFLATGLLWGLLIENNTSIVFFFLCCIIIAGIYGAMTAKPVIFWIQAAPAIIASLALYYS
jgi:putative membrane protein